MTRVNVGTLKNELSRFLKLASEGEDVVVVSHERAIARIVPYETTALVTIRPPRRPAADLAKMKGIRPTGELDIVRMLVEDRRRR